MYTSPELYGTQDFLCSADAPKVELCEQECLKKSVIPCDEAVFDACVMLMLRDNLNFPNDAAEAIELYLHLRGEIHQELGID
jgi:hypothetical protein